MRNLPHALHFAVMAGRCWAYRDDCMRDARATSGPLRTHFVKSARVWNHTYLRHAERAKRWYAADLEVGKSALVRRPHGLF